jgi:hypothetical protein
MSDDEPYTDDPEFVFAVAKLRRLSPLRRQIAVWCAGAWSSDLFAQKVAMVDEHREPKVVMQ